MIARLLGGFVAQKSQAKNRLFLGLQTRCSRLIPETMGFQQHVAAIRHSLSEIESNLVSIVDRSELANSVPQVIAVSKQQPEEKIRAALEIGHRHFGENKVQEAQKHWAELKSQYADTVLHLIGPLQSNKAADAVALFDVIHTIDRPKIADAVARACERQQKTVPCFIQINTGEEDQKSGVAPKDAAALIAHCHRHTNLPIIGLMCIPPAQANPAPHFALLQKLAKEHGLTELSMGMSADYETAARFGSTYVRIGTGIFGSRN